MIGASGDLAKKKTYPALYELYKAHLLPTETQILGFARSKKTHDELREHLKGPLCKAHPDNEEADIDDFLQLCTYTAGASYGDHAVLQQMLQQEQTKGSLYNFLAYLAIPPYVFGEATLALKKVLEEKPTSEVQVPGFTRVVLEKPFGHDTDSCNSLLQTLKDQKWEERSLYRIDHYLGKEMVQNILTLRQHNPWLAQPAIWSRQMVQSVHLIFKEPFGTDGRGGYFDPYGIVRDILQNHLLQVLTLVAMDMPSGDKMNNNNAIRDAKVKVLKNIAPFVLQDCLFGQYDGYKEDPTIENRNTITPTYACMKCTVDTDTWRGVPFVLEAGKALDERLCEVRFHFRGGDCKNAMVLRLQPTPAIFFTANLKTPGFSKTPVSTHIGVDYGQAEKPGAYTRLLLDVLRGQQASFVRDDELLDAWKIFTPILNQMERDQVVPDSYVEGSEGPEGRNAFLRAVGIEHAWLPPPAAL